MLAITAVSVAALIGAGVSSHSDPDLAGRAALARLSGEVVSGVTSEWERIRRDPDLIESELAWSTETAPAPQTVVLLISTKTNVVAEALLVEANRLAREGGDALGTLLQVFEKKPDTAQMAIARLRAIQLAVRAEQPGIAREQWQLARTELAPQQCVDDTSQLLLCALAAVPALSLEERATARDELVTHWISGALALPAADVATLPLREAYRKRLQDMLPEAGLEPRLERNLLMERARRVATQAGRALSPASDNGWSCLSAGKQELLYRLSGEDLVEGLFAAEGTLGGLITAAAETAGLLPDDFTLDFAGTLEDAGAIVRQRVELNFGAPGFVLRHANPEAVIGEVSDRQAMVRAALFALSLAVGAAGLSVFRASRRERYLGELKSSFVANVSHELRTPVSSILLMAENLENGRVTDEATRNRYHKLIRREANRLRTLVNDVLDFSRIERGKGVHLSLNQVDLQAFASELEIEARERVTMAGGELQFASKNIPDSIVADEDALRRATLNLIENALRHSGVKDVELSLDRDSEDGLKLAVRDRGCGVPAARLESLFAPFERLEVSLGDAGDSAGTGLGLAIVREIAEGHGGSATARNPEGPGVLFEIRVPARPPMKTIKTMEPT